MLEIISQPRTFWRKLKGTSIADWWHEPERPCPDCNDYGQVIIQDGRDELEIDCHCLLRLEDLRSLKEAKMFDKFPYERYRNETFDNTLVPDGDPKPMKWWWRADAAVREFTMDPVGNLTLSGFPGTGKTRYAALIYMFCGVPGVWLNVPSFSSGMTTMFGAKNGELDHVLTVMSTTPLLIFDDIGRGGLEFSAGIQANLYTIINARHDSLLPTVYTTNVTFDDLNKSIPAIASRIFEKSQTRDNLLYFVVPDFRRIERNNK
jgi:DNA replication protein DnaC